MKTIIVSIKVVLLLLISLDINAQQDPQYTHYMYNTLSVNSAYAGSRDNLSAVLLHRTQWAGLDGAPNTQTFSVHSPIGSKVGLGFSLVRDEIFISSETYFDANFSYSIDVSEKSQLAFGIKAGGHLLDVDFKKAVTGPFSVEASEALSNVNQLSPQLGLGTYLYSDNYYLGLSVPNFFKTDHFSDSENTNTFIASERLHFFLIGGYVFEVSDTFKFKPSFLVKAVEGSPLAVDLSANALLFNRLILGAAFRLDSAVSAMAGFHLTDRIHLGFAYDYDTTPLQNFNNGSFEMFLRFELRRKRSGVDNPRFF